MFLLHTLVSTGVAQPLNPDLNQARFVVLLLDTAADSF